MVFGRIEHLLLFLICTRSHFLGDKEGISCYFSKGYSIMKAQRDIASFVLRFTQELWQDPQGEPRVEWRQVQPGDLDPQ